MKTLALILLACLAPLAARTAVASDALVLVAGANSPLATPDSLAVRKAFMGLNASARNLGFRAAINAGDPSLRPAFLQHVVGFSEETYLRRSLTLTMQQGIREPPTFRDEALLVRALQTDGLMVSFMWQSHADRIPSLRVLKVLWRN